MGGRLKLKEWAGPSGDVAREVLEQSTRCLATYREDRLRVEQDAAIEAGIAQGGYGRKQLYELVQNGADALLGAMGDIEVVLSEECLYVANEGRPMTVDGVSAMMASHLSRKRGDEIGRFGLGFKSVIAISDAPQVFSRSGSFGFDREHARSAISEIVPDAPSYPIMRVAQPIDAGSEAGQDPVLEGLMAWAATIIKIPLSGGYSSLKEDLQAFPAAFLLFSPHARTLTLRDLRADTSRVINVTSGNDGVHVLSDSGTDGSGTETRWRVAVRDHKPTKEALKDAGELAHRERITVAWAVPLSGANALGQLWAFFPTQDRTTLSGIVNAPWKLSDDRRNLLPGAFNEEILTEVLPAIIAAEWPKLHNAQDPAWALDLLPARGREERSWADDQMNRPIIDKIRGIPSLPDVEGTLRAPKTLHIHPRGLAAPELDTWLSLRPAPNGWVHHSIDSNNERRAKAERLLDSGDEAALATPAEWAEALVEEPSSAASAIAIEVVRLLGRHDHELALAARSARVVLLEDGTLAPAKRGHVFVRSSPTDEGFEFIHPDLAKMPGVVGALNELGIRLLDRAGELRNALTGKDPARVNWDGVWNLSRDCSQDVAATIFSDELASPIERSLKVRNRVGAFVPLANAFVPGGVIKAGARGDERFTIDVDFHRDDLELLERLGAVSQPVLRAKASQEPWLRSYEELIKEEYINGESGTKPAIEKLVVDGPTPPWPLDPLSGLSPDSAAALTEVALSLTSGRNWTVRHGTSSKYPTKTYRDPVQWWVHKHGQLLTGIGPFPARECMRAADDVPSDVFPTVVMSDEAAKQIGLKESLDDLTDATWTRLFAMAGTWDPERRSTLYAWGAYKTGPPETVVAGTGDRPRPFPTHEVAVVSGQEDFRSLAEQRSPVILVNDPADVEQLVAAWGMEDGKALLDQDLAFEPNGEPQVLVDAFPKLRMWDVPASIKLQLCESIELVTVTNSGTRSRPIECFLNEDVLLSVAADPQHALKHVSELLQLDMTNDEITSVIDQVRSQELNKLIATVRSAEGVEDRLALLVGEEALMRQVPAAALEAVALELGREPTGLELARLVLAVHGVRSLQTFKTVLEDKGLTPPTQWAGVPPRVASFRTSGSRPSSPVSPQTLVRPCSEWKARPN